MPPQHLTSVRKNGPSDGLLQTDWDMTGHNAIPTQRPCSPEPVILKVCSAAGIHEGLQGNPQNRLFFLCSSCGKKGWDRCLCGDSERNPSGLLNSPVFP